MKRKVDTPLSSLIQGQISPESIWHFCRSPFPSHLQAEKTDIINTLLFIYLKYITLYRSDLKLNILLRTNTTPQTKHHLLFFFSLSSNPLICHLKQNTDTCFVSKLQKRATASPAIWIGLKMIVCIALFGRRKTILFVRFFDLEKSCHYRMQIKCKRKSACNYVIMQLHTNNQATVRTYSL